MGRGRRAYNEAMQKTADDITNQQLLEALTDQFGRIADNMATKDDLAALGRELRAEMATKLDIAAVRRDIKRLEGKYDHMREGLARAGEPI